MFWNYLIVALRNLLRHKTYSAINIAGLAIGMAGCIIISLWVYYHFSFDSFHEKADRIYRLNGILTLPNKSAQYFGLSLGPSGPVMLEEYPEVINCTRFYSENYHFEESGSFFTLYKERQIHVDGAVYTDPSVFDVFSFELLAGDAKTALTEPNSIVITEKTARMIFGNEDPLGKVIQRKGESGYKVTGVLKDIPPNSHIQFNMLISINTLGEWINLSWREFEMYTYLLLEKGVDVKALESKFPEFVQKYKPEFAEIAVHYLQPLEDIHLHSSHIRFDWNTNKSDLAYVYVFSAIAILILVIACINYMNLATARSIGRAREVGIRKVVGARKSQLIKQFLAESVFLSFCALLIAIALIELTLPTLNDFFGNVFVFNYFDNWALTAALAGIAILVGVLAGSYPAFFISAFQPVTVLKGMTNIVARGLTLRRTLVVTQFAISIILIVCTVFISSQLYYMQTKDTGFNKDQVITIPMNDSRVRKTFESMKQEMMKHHAVSGVTASQKCFGKDLGFIPIDFEGHNKDEFVGVAKMAVTHDFLSFYGLEIVEGRDFSLEFPADLSQDFSGAFIINEALGKKLDWDSPVGKKFGVKGYKLGTVIGVVQDFHFRSLHHAIEPFIFFLYPNWLNKISVRIRPGNIDETLKYLERIWYEYAPADPFEYSFLDDDFARLYENEKKTRIIIGAFSLLAIFVACLGLFGLISFAAEQRTKEIGIRKVLGASVSSIVLLLSKEFLMLLGFAILIAWPVAWYFMDRWLQNFAYRIELGPGIFLLGGGLALAIALLTVSFQAVKAATANPVEALRYE